MFESSFISLKTPRCFDILIVTGGRVKSAQFHAFSGVTLNYIIESIPQSSVKKLGSLGCAKQFLSPESVLHLYKSTIRSGIEYCLLLLLCV